MILTGRLKENYNDQFQLRVGVDVHGSCCSSCPAGKSPVLTFLEEAECLGPSSAWMAAQLVDVLGCADRESLMNYAASQGGLRVLGYCASTSNLMLLPELLKLKTPLSAADYGSFVSCLPVDVAASAFVQALCQSATFGAPTSARHPAWADQPLKALTPNEVKTLLDAPKNKLIPAKKILAGISRPAVHLPANDSGARSRQRPRQDERIQGVR